MSLIGAKAGQAGGDTEPGSTAGTGRDMALYPPGLVMERWRADDNSLGLKTKPRH